MNLLQTLGVAVVVALLPLAGTAAAQGTSLQGRVVDPAGGAVARAAIVLTHVTSNDVRTAETRGDGTFSFAGLPPGPYRLEIAASGFSLHAREITVGAGAAPLQIPLTIAPREEQITVEAVATVPTVGRINVPLRDQPFTVNTLTSDVLEARAINDLVSALQLVPNVNGYTTYGVYQSFTFRGFSESVQLVDGLRNEGNLVNTQLGNIERVEVLKGPASVLYGNNAIGGTVNLVIKKPSAEPVYDFSGAAGRWDTYRGTLGAGGRLGSNRVLYRLDVAGESATNFRQDASKRFNVTPSVTWRIGSGGQFDARYFYDRVDVGGDGGIPLVPLDGSFVPDPERTAIGDPLSRAITSSTTVAIPIVPLTSRYNTPQDYGLSTDHNVRATYAHAFGSRARVSFRNTVGYRHNDDDYFVTEFLDVTPPSTVNRGILYFKHHRRPLTNQAELSGRFRLGVDHDFLVGWDLQRYNSHTHRRPGANFNTTTIDLYDPVETHVAVDIDGFPINRIDYQKTLTNGFFFQNMWTLGSKVRVVVGGRADDVDRSRFNNPVANGIETDGPVIEERQSAFTYRAGAVYQPTPSIDLYLQHSTAFKPEYRQQPDGTPLEPETGVQYEGGTRLRMLSGRLDLTTALFQVTKENLARNLGGGLFEQIGKLRSQGVEVELAGRPVSRLLLTLGYGFTHARFLEYISGSQNLSGNRPRRTPKHTMTFSTSYGWDNGFALMLAGKVRSDEFLGDNQTLAFNGYELLDVGASYTRGAVQFALNVTNVTNREYWASSLGSRQLYPGQPINAMASVRIRTR